MTRLVQNLWTKPPSKKRQTSLWTGPFRCVFFLTLTKKLKKKKHELFSRFWRFGDEKNPKTPDGRFPGSPAGTPPHWQDLLRQAWGETKWVVLVGVDTLVCWLLLPKRDPGQIIASKSPWNVIVVTKGSPPKSSNITLSNSGLGCIIMWPEGMGKSYLKFAFANAKFWQMCDPFGTLFSTHDHTLYD